MTSYEISGIKQRTDYSYVIKNINEDIGREIIKLKYDRGRGVLTFSTETRINALRLRIKLAEKDLEFKVLK